MATSVKQLVEDRLKVKIRSLREHVFGVYANDHPQTRSLKQQLERIGNRPFIRVAIVTVNGASPQIQRDLDTATEVLERECGIWVYPTASIVVDRPHLLILNQHDCNHPFTVIFLGDVSHNVSAEEDELFDIGRNLGAKIVAYYIGGSNLAKVACAAHPVGRPGFWVMNDGNGEWTFVHELCHLAKLRDEDSNKKNLMFTPTPDIEDPPPDLSSEQCLHIRRLAEPPLPPPFPPPLFP